MAGDRKDTGPDSFDERLSRAQKKAQDEWTEPDRAKSPMGVAFKMGIELVVGSGVGAFIGYWFDKWFGTAPIFLIVLLILGFASGVRNVIREAQRLQDADEEAE